MYLFFIFANTTQNLVDNIHNLSLKLHIHTYIHRPPLKHSVWNRKWYEVSLWMIEMIKVGVYHPVHCRQSHLLTPQTVSYIDVICTQLCVSVHTIFRKDLTIHMCLLFMYTMFNVCVLVFIQFLGKKLLFGWITLAIHLCLLFIYVHLRRFCWEFQSFAPSVLYAHYSACLHDFRQFLAWKLFSKLLKTVELFELSCERNYFMIAYASKAWKGTVCSKFIARSIGFKTLNT